MTEIPNQLISSPITSEQVVQITIPVSLKLDRSNFLTWKPQIEPIVNGFGLWHHLDESSTTPPAFLDNNGTNPQSNPQFLTWQKQDQLLLGWMRSAITGPVLAQHISCRTARDLWKSLHRVYSAVSKAKIMELRRLLQTTTRGGLSCNEYFEKMRGLVDQLTAIGYPVSDSDLVSHILTGLGSDYNSL